MEKYSITLYFVGFIVFAQVLTFGLVLKNFLNVRLKKGGSQRRGIDELPRYLQELFAAPLKELEDLGFMLFHCQLTEDILVSAYSQKWEIVLIHEDKAVYATLSTPPLPDKVASVRVEFLTFFSDNSKLLTLNGEAHDIIGEIPNVVLNDRYAVDIEQQFQGHLDELTKLTASKSPLLVTENHFVNDSTNTIEQYIANLESNKITKCLDDQTYRICLFPAARQAIRSMTGKRKVKALRNKQKKQMKSQNTSQPDIPVEVEVEAFQKMYQIQKPVKSSQLGKLAVFIVSMLLFMLSFRVAFSFKTVLVFVVVIFLHELGHMLGMYLFKYKDVQVMFLPFMGAATSGGGKKATAFQQVIVYLLGPGPGIILGTLCIVLNNIYGSEILFEFGLFMLVLNYINLLPILPLDGGRVFELVLFSRVHFLRISFLLFSIVILGLGGLLSHSPILMIIPLFLLISLPLQFMNFRSHSKLMKKIKEENLELEDDVLVPAIFSILKEKTFSKMAFEQKFQIAKTLLNNAVKKPPTIGVSVLSLFIYFIVWISPAFVALAAGVIIFFSSASSNYDKGVVSFYTFPDSDKVCVTNSSGMFNRFSFILGEDGHVVSDLGKHASFLSKESIWHPNGKSVLFEKTSPWQAFGKQSTKPSPLVLKDIETNQLEEIKRPEGPENSYFNFSQWSDDGSCLLGSKTAYIDDSYDTKSSIFRFDIKSGNINEFEIGLEDFYPTFTSGGNIILNTYLEDEEDADTPQTVGIYNINTKEIMDYKLPKDTLSWEVTSDGDALIVIQKLYGDNTVSFQIVEINLNDNSQDILIDKAKLPSHTFEDAARGKQAWLTIELSPSDRWVMCIAKDHTQKDLRWLYDRNNESCLKFMELDVKEIFISNMAYSADENLICVCKSSNNYLETENEAKNDHLEIYDLSGDLPVKIKDFECDQNCYDYQFFKNECLLYIKSTDDISFWKNENELWAMDIADGSKRKFIQSSK